MDPDPHQDVMDPEHCFLLNHGQTSAHSLAGRLLLLNFCEDIRGRLEVLDAHAVVGAAHQRALERAALAAAAHLGRHRLVVHMAALGVPHRVLNRLLAPRV